MKKNRLVSASAVYLSFVLFPYDPIFLTHPNKIKPYIHYAALYPYTYIYIQLMTTSHFFQV